MEIHGYWWQYTTNNYMIYWNLNQYRQRIIKDKYETKNDNLYFVEIDVFWRSVAVVKGKWDHFERYKTW